MGKVSSDILRSYSDTGPIICADYQHNAGPSEVLLDGKHVARFAEWLWLNDAYNRLPGHIFRH